ncbi:MAG: hypothetical protein Q9195_004772 [Heterodermia aff. obscurata]
MASDDPASLNKTIAWDTGVDLAHLSARLLSYLTTKATISTFRFAMKYSSTEACRNLPEELLMMIANAVREPCFRLELEKWDILSKLIAKMCEIFAVPSQGEVNRKLTMVYKHAGCRGHLGVWFPHDYAESNSEPNPHHRVQLSGKSASTLAKCKEIFAQEFGIRPLFLLRRKYPNGDARNHAPWNHYPVEAKAYLTLPMNRISKEPHPDSEPMLLYVGNFLDRSRATARLESLTEEQRQRLRRANKVLGIHKSDETPEAFMYEKPESNSEPEPESSGGFC